MTEKPQHIEPQVTFRTTRERGDKSERPGCLTAYAILMFFSGGMNLLYAFCLGSATLTSPSEFGEIGIILPICTGASALLPIILGIGLWLMTKWAWWWMMIGQAGVVVGGILGVIVSFLFNEPMFIISAVILAMVNLAVNGGILYWFFINQDLFNVGDPETGVSGETLLTLLAGVAVVMILITGGVILLFTMLGGSIGDIFSGIVPEL